jgi:hypothetical protein
MVIATSIEIADEATTGKKQKCKFLMSWVWA